MVRLCGVLVLGGAGSWMWFAVRIVDLLCVRVSGKFVKLLRSELRQGFLVVVVPGVSVV